jgi:cytochrome b involved in lipid metabolism
MKKIVTISLGIFVLVLVVVFAMWFGSMQNKSGVNQNSVQNQEQVVEKPKLTLDMQEVARHNTSQDCWTVVREKVYNVTAFSSLHTGGADKIIYNCGKDGTVGFDTKGEKGSHKEGSIDVLNKYLLGDLVTYPGK